MTTRENPPRAEMHEPDRIPREESIGQLFKELSSDLSALVRQEIRPV